MSVLEHRKQLLPRNFKVFIDTELVKDTFVIKCPRDPEAAETFNVERILEEIRIKYEKWHAFPVFEFQLCLNEQQQPLQKTSLLQSIIADPNAKLRAEESALSIQRRKEEKERMELDRIRREREAIAREEKRRLQILELLEIGDCWTFDNNNPSLEVSVEEKGLLVRNKGSLDQWCPIHRVRIISPEGKYFFAMKILKDPPTTNTWRFCIGVVPVSFKINGERRWIGAQKSWSYVCGNGGKCHNSGKNEKYGEKYGEGDVIGVLLDFDQGTIEFWKNGVSQGIAFRNLAGPVYPAVSMTAKDAEILLVDDYPPEVSDVVMSSRVSEIRKLNRWKNISSEEFHEERLKKALLGENSWDVRFSLNRDRSLFFPDSCVRSVVNEGSGDKWRSVKSIGSYEKDICYFEVFINRDTSTVNTWRICVGVVPIGFRCDVARAWVGSQNSWGYIAGTGGKTFNSGQAMAYGEPYEEGDLIGVLMDFNKGTLEFFRNGISQGIAFDNLRGPVYAAVSLTGTNAMVSLRNVDSSFIQKQKEMANDRVSRVSEILQKYGNIWDKRKCSSEVIIEENGLRAINMGAKNRWRTVASLLPYTSGRRYFEVIINELPFSTNNWRICVGVIPRGFDFTSPKIWVGGQRSFGYIAGTGGKCHNSEKSISYGAKFSRGSRIGCLMDFEDRTIEFFKNGVSQGVAFQGLLNGPVFAAVSMTSANACVSFVPNIEQQEEIVEKLVLYT